MIGKRIALSLSFAAIFAQAGAQEFGMELNAGLQGMHYSLQHGQTKGLPSGSLGVNYTYWFSGNWGVLTGLTGGLYRTQATIQDGQVFTYNQVDDVGSAFQYRLKTSGYKETQHFIAASIPVLLQYRMDGSGKQWYFDGGARFFVPFNATSDISANQLSLSGYYPDFNVEVPNLPQHGFGTLNNWRSSTATKLKPAVALSAATGIVFRLSTSQSLYAGVFVDYGVTSLKSGKDSLPLVTYSPSGTKGAQANGVLNTSLAGSPKILSFGIQIRLSFGSAPAALAERHKTEAGPQQPAVSYDKAGIILGPVVFGLIGETAIPESQKSQLDEVVNLMKQYPDIKISIVGHYCGSETEPEGRNIGEARAKAVARYLQGKGVARSRMDVGSAIESDPVLPGDPNASYQNRRVVIAVE